jgi:hypothetical protein
MSRAINGDQSSNANVKRKWVFFYEMEQGKFELCSIKFIIIIDPQR